MGVVETAMITQPISQRGLQFILERIDLDSLTMPGDLLLDAFGDIAHELIDNGWMRRIERLEEYTLYQDEDPYMIEWREEHQAYCYFSHAFFKWRPVDENRAHRQGVSMPALISWLAQQCCVGNLDALKVLMDGKLWYLGSGTLEGLTYYVYFLCCFDKAQVDITNQKLTAAAGRTPAIVLAPTERHFPVEPLPAGMAAMAISEMLVENQDKQVAIDKTFIKNLDKQLGRKRPSFKRGVAVLCAFSCLSICFSCSCTYFLMTSSLALPMVSTK